MRRILSSLLAATVAGCSFGFAGGGFPPDIKTVAIEPFDNNSADPGIAQAVNQAVQQAMQSRLGLRPAPEAQADAVVHGKVVRYDTDQPLAYSGTPATPGSVATVDVTRRQVELTVDIQVVEQKTGHVLWDGRSQVVQGEYAPGQIASGRQKALDALVNKMIDGVHQNW